MEGVPRGHLPTGGRPWAGKGGSSCGMGLELLEQRRKNLVSGPRAFLRELSRAKPDAVEKPRASSQLHRWNPRRVLFRPFLPMLPSGVHRVTERASGGGNAFQVILPAESFRFACESLHHHFYGKRGDGAAKARLLRRVRIATDGRRTGGGPAENTREGPSGVKLISDAPPKPDCIPDPSI